MTVFKGFLIITKRNLLMVFMYLAIFLTISESLPPAATAILPAPGSMPKHSR